MSINPLWQRVACWTPSLFLVTMRACTQLISGVEFLSCSLKILRKYGANEGPVGKEGFPQDILIFGDKEEE